MSTPNRSTVAEELENVNIPTAKGPQLEWLNENVKA